MQIFITGPERLLTSAGLDAKPVALYPEETDRALALGVKLLIETAEGVMVAGAFVQSVDALVGLATRLRSAARRADPTEPRVVINIFVKSEIHKSITLAPNPDSAEILSFLKEAAELSAPEQRGIAPQLQLA
jgi:hypothetical protein